MTDHTQSGQTEQLVPKNVDLRKARFRVETISGTVYEGVRLMPGDVVGAEREFDIRASDMEHGSKLEHLLYMVWLAAQRKGYSADFETFVAEVQELDVIQSEAAGNPTQPAR